MRLPSITTPLPVIWLAACFVQGFHTSGSRFVEKTFTTEFSTTPVFGSAAELEPAVFAGLAAADS
jgi:hypothetical protein